MHTTVRPYATAGVALVGAGVIAVSPMAPPLPDIHVPHVSAAVELTQFVNPITEWISVLTTAAANTVALAQRAAEFPIAAAVISNGFAYTTALASDLQMAVSGLVSGLQGLPAALQTAFGQLTTG